jgi:hypothetical protein
VPQQGQGPEPEHVRGGLVPGDQQQLGDADQLVRGQVVPVLAHEHPEHVVARRRLRPRDQVRHVLAALPAQLEALVHRQRDVEQLLVRSGTDARSA